MPPAKSQTSWTDSHELSSPWMTQTQEQFIEFLVETYKYLKLPQLKFSYTYHHQYEEDFAQYVHSTKYLDHFLPEVM